MKFEWDTVKNELNLEKHGIDFETAKDIWLDENRIEIEAPYPIENRWIVIGTAQGKVWAAVYTMRKGVIRMISVRRARAKEVRLYEEKTPG
ncbi:MAG TPA: BrnT family toxin [Syntrophorhabdaceae bacterium]|nr:BrnT family toxin [Syntrophorhabdaceae bacterium]